MQIRHLSITFLIICSIPGLKNTALSSCDIFFVPPCPFFIWNSVTNSSNFDPYANIKIFFSLFGKTNVLKIIFCSFISYRLICLKIERCIAERVRLSVFDGIVSLSIIHSLIVLHRSFVWKDSTTWINFSSTIGNLHGKTAVTSIIKGRTPLTCSAVLIRYASSLAVNIMHVHTQWATDPWLLYPPSQWQTSHFLSTVVGTVSFRFRLSILFLLDEILHFAGLAVLMPPKNFSVESRRLALFEKYTSINSS